MIYGKILYHHTNLRKTPFIKYFDILRKLLIQR